MPIESLSAVVYSSREPGRLANFYRHHLGIPFEPRSHGPLREHMEASLSGIHFAVLPSADPRKETGVGVAPTFRVKGLDAFVEALGKEGIAPLHRVLDLEQGMRVASFRDADENIFRLIEFGS